MILVGEIRDEETAKIAVQAALTGHLVLSSLHCHSAPSAIERLKNMEIEPSLLATSLNCVIGQRLPPPLPGVPRAVHSLTRGRYGTRPRARPRSAPLPSEGLRDCSQTGFLGRVALYEVMVVDGKVRRLLDASTDEIAAAAVEQGMKTMREEGIQLCLDGVSSLDEIKRITGDRVG